MLKKQLNTVKEPATYHLITSLDPLENQVYRYELIR